MTLLRGRAALETLAAETSNRENSQSGYWREEVQNFEVDVQGNVTGATVLGSVSVKSGPFYSFAHWALQTPFRFMGGRKPGLRRLESLVRVIAKRQGRQYTHDMMRQALTLAFARRAARRRADSCNLVIGDGYGVLTSLLLTDDPHARVICVNLTKPLLLDLTWAKKALPDVEPVLAASESDMAAAMADPAVRLIAVRADDADIIAAAPVHAAFNVVSMQEMPTQAIAGYFRILRANPADETIFYCCNKLSKTLPGGAEIKFHDYPWRAGDETVAEGPCPWSQWIYNGRPPFWIHRSGEGRVIWHRLARMEKDRP
ncbi:MAG: hypothetical protein ACYYKD_01945 [Rhodospirillales bacterium]